MNKTEKSEVSYYRIYGLLPDEDNETVCIIIRDQRGMLFSAMPIRELEDMREGKRYFFCRAGGRNFEIVSVTQKLAETAQYASAALDASDFCDEYADFDSDPRHLGVTESGAYPYLL